MIGDRWMECLDGDVNRMVCGTGVVWRVVKLDRIGLDEVEAG